MANGLTELEEEALNLLRGIEWTGDGEGAVTFCPACGQCQDDACSEHYDGGWDCTHDDDDPDDEHSIDNPGCHPCGEQHGHAIGCGVSDLIARLQAKKVAGEAWVEGLVSRG